MTPEEQAEKRKERYRLYNAKRCADPAYIAKRREWGMARYRAQKGTEAYLEAQRIASARRRELRPEREAIRLATRRSIERGDLVKQPCEVCGEVKVDAHHDDYSRPLSVRWLCRPHHVAHHARVNRALRASAAEGAGHD